MDKLSIGQKVTNQGTSAAGKLSAKEFNDVVDKINELVEHGNTRDKAYESRVDNVSKSKIVMLAADGSSSERDSRVDVLRNADAVKIVIRPQHLDDKGNAIVDTEHWANFVTLKSATTRYGGLITSDQYKYITSLMAKFANVNDIGASSDDGSDVIDENTMSDILSNVFYDETLPIKISLTKFIDSQDTTFEQIATFMNVTGGDLINIIAHHKERTWLVSWLSLQNNSATFYEPTSVEFDSEHSMVTISGQDAPPDGVKYTIYIKIKDSNSFITYINYQ